VRNEPQSRIVKRADEEADPSPRSPRRKSKELQMKKLFGSKKRLAVAAGTAAMVMAGATAAFAYFTSTGSGSSSATVGSTSPWTVSPGTASYTGDTALTPQSSSCLPASASFDGTDGTCAVYESVPYSVTNPNSGNQDLSSVVVSISANASTTSNWQVKDSHGNVICSYADFAIDGVAGGAAQTDTTLAGDFTPSQVKSTGAVTVTMVDTSAVQNGCAGQTVPLYFYAS
jgi:hypothetical protein